MGRYSIAQHCIARLFGGYTIDADPNNTTTLVIGFAVAILLTFPPERVMLASIATIRRAITTLQA